MPTTNLGIAYLAAGQSQKEVTANAAFDGLDKAMTEMLEVPLGAGNGTLTTADGAGNAVLRLTGSIGAATRIVTVPAKRKMYGVLADFTATTGGKVTVRTPSGSGVDFNSGESGLVYCDGVAVRLLAK